MKGGIEENGGRKGKNHPKYGKSVSEETKEKISKTQKGKALEKK